MTDRRLFVFIYCLSGLAALIYEVAWSRMLSLHMGHTVAAVSTVLASFMGGMALGATLAGRFGARVSRSGALAAYAALEIGIAVSALALPLALALTRPLLVWAYADGDGGATFGVVRLITSLIALGVPAAAMGATFPLASRWFVTRADAAGSEAGALYAANTVGATAGAALAAFVLIPLAGLRASTFVAAGLNVIAAAVAWKLASREPPVSSPARSSREPVAPGFRLRRRLRRTAVASAEAVSPAKPSRASRRKERKAHATELEAARPALAAAVVGLTGFVALVLEVAWTRILAQIIGPTTYAFGTMLAVFIGGLAIGSTIGAELAGRARRVTPWLASAMVLTGAAALAGLTLTGRLPLVIARVVTSTGEPAAFRSIVGLEAWYVAAVLVPMTVGLGAAFPLALRLAVRRGDAVSLDVAIVYATNTLGAIVGALAGGFVLVPLAGLEATVLAVAALVAAGAVAAAVTLGPRRGATRIALSIAATAVVAACALFPRWDRELMSSGAYKYAPYIRSGDLESALKAGALLYYKEGAAATVSVRRVAGAVSLAIDGKVDASNAGDMLTQKLLAHLPLLLHPNPREVAIVGLGSGVTLGAALRHPIARADTLEISPEVVEASSFFTTENHDALRDRRSRLIVGDGRSHLLLARRRYDVIISEPSNPWMAGVASLFTREFFRAARARLAPGGLVCQWAHTYDISEADLKSIAATFASIFPETTMWLVGAGDVLLVGAEKSLADRLATLAHAYERPGVRADLADVRVSGPGSLLSLYVAGPREVARYAAGARIQTDDRTALEFSAPRSIYGAGANNADVLRGLASVADLPAPVRAARESGGADEWRHRAEMLLGAEAWQPALDAFLRALPLAPTDETVLTGLSRAAAGAGRLDQAVAALRQLAAQHPANVPIRIELSRLLATRGEVDEAMRVATDAGTAQPTDPRPAEQLASILADLGDFARLRPLVAEMRRVWGDRAGVLYYGAAAEYLEGKIEAAQPLAERAVALSPGDAKARNILGAIYASAGRRDDARRAFEASITANPRDPAAYVNLGLLELESANPAAAVDYFAEALSLDPTEQGAARGLIEARQRLGQPARVPRSGSN